MGKSLHEKHGQDAPKVLQGMMIGAAKKNSPLPEGFSADFSQSPTVIITKGDVSLDIGLCDYHGAVKAIQAFCK